MRRLYLRTQCLIWCVLLVFNDFAGLINGLHHKAQYYRQNIGSVDGFEKAQEENNKDTDGGSCQKWEEYNGIDCVCARAGPLHNPCEGQNGMICDEQGKQYLSGCHFALDMCQEKISYKRTVKSCGFCKMLRLSYMEKGFPSDFVYFRRVGKNQGNRTVYASLQDQSTLFFEETLNAWVIGIQNNTGSFVSVVQPIYSPYPQDYIGKMLIVSANATHTAMKTTSFLKLECVPDLNIHKVNEKLQKRFILSLIAIISTVIVVTATTLTSTLKAVQHQRGCLYFPSVCTMRDEIKNHLKPELNRMKRHFDERFGDSAALKESANGILTYAMDIRDHLIVIKDLHIQTKSIMSEMNEALHFRTSVDLSILQTYELFLKSFEDFSGQNEMILANTIYTAIETTYLCLTTLETTVSATSVAFGIAGAAFSIAFTIYDIVSSVSEERKVRDGLHRAKLAFTTAKQRLQTAEKHIIRFQKTFCKGVLVYLRRISRRGSPYHNVFKNLFNKIVSIYGSSENSCKNKYIYSATTAAVLINLRDGYILPLKTYLSKNVQNLKAKQKNIIRTRTFFKIIQERVRANHTRPSTLFNDIRSYGTDVSQEYFPNLFKLLRYISFKVLPTEVCYWGYNLDLIRNRTITEDNYLHSALCQSSEIRDIEGIIRKSISKRKNPTDIFESIKGFEFRNKYLLIKFIADHILQESKCYWGYDLESARNSPNEKRIQTAKISLGLFLFLKVLPTRDKGQVDLKKSKEILCSIFLICNVEWQTLLLCSVLGKTVEKGMLSCSSPLPSCLP